MMQNDWEIIAAVDAWKLKAADESYEARYKEDEEMMDETKEKLEKLEEFVDNNCRNCKHYEFDGKYHNCFLCDLYDDGVDDDGVCKDRAPVIGGEWVFGTPEEDGDYLVYMDYLVIGTLKEPIRVSYFMDMHWHDGWCRYSDNDPKTLIDSKVVAYCKGLEIPDVPEGKLNIINETWDNERMCNDEQKED